MFVYSLSPRLFSLDRVLRARARMRCILRSQKVRRPVPCVQTCIVARTGPGGKSRGRLCMIPSRVFRALSFLVLYSAPVKTIERNLQSKESKLGVGKGFFPSAPLTRGLFVAEYTGTKIPAEEANR